MRFAQSDAPHGNARGFAARKLSGCVARRCMHRMLLALLSRGILEGMKLPK